VIPRVTFPEVISWVVIPASLSLATIKGVWAEVSIFAAAANRRTKINDLQFIILFIVNYLYICRCGLP
jgi:hypothetical protein